MTRRVTREYVDEGGDDYVADRRPWFNFNPIATIVGLILLIVLLWAIFADSGPINELFDGDGQAPNINVDAPTINE